MSTLLFSWCPEQASYFVARRINPPLRAMGVMPNYITLANCVVKLLTCRAICWEMWGQAWFFMLLQQVLDAADGEMARTYNLRSEFGHWLDHTSDDFYGLGFVGSIMYLFRCHPMAMVACFFAGCISAFFCHASMSRKTSVWKLMTFPERVGKIYEEFMPAILGAALILAYTYKC